VEKCGRDTIGGAVMANARAFGTESWRGLLHRTARRAGTIGALRGAALVIALCAMWFVVQIVRPPNGAREWSALANGLLVSVVAIVGGLAGWFAAYPGSRRAAVLLEQRVPTLGNLLVTAEEFLRAPASATINADVRDLVEQRANRAALMVDLAQAFPFTSAWWGVLLAMVVCASSIAAGGGRLRTVTAPVNALIAAATGRATITDVRVVITPPRYSRQAVVELSNPTRINALQGSTVRVTVRATVDTLRITTRDSAGMLLRDTDGAFVYTVIVANDGYVGLDARSTRADENGDKRLIGLTVRTDDAPQIRIVAPASDLLLPDARRTLAIHAQANDDLGIGTVRVRYTKVSGSGERFTFSEGELPVAITRASLGAWTAHADLALAPLLQEPGDVVVYRAVVTDTRPGSPPVESDALIAELAAPGGVAALGFALDPDEDRYALSQQMVIQKTERLIAQRASLPPTQLAEQSQQLASEQRRVRAEFVFMMGGEFAQQATGEDGMMELDEHEEAESEGDLAAGRMVNRGRTALLAAVRAMSRAAVALTTADLAPALVQERRALAQLQEAFARNRFLMRALSQREQLDLTRRLTGVREGIATNALPVPEGESSARQIALRALLADLTAAVFASPNLHGNNGRRAVHPFAAIAERLLQVDPSSVIAQRVAAQLSAVAPSASSGRAPLNASQRVMLDSAATGLTSLLRTDARASAPASRSLGARRLQAALEAALRSTPRSPPPRSLPPRPGTR